MKFYCTDGGRSLAGYTGKAGDCVVRALTIATGSSYMNMYQFINSTARAFETRQKVKSNNVHGVYDDALHGIMKVLKFKWNPNKGKMLKIPSKGTYIVSLVGHVCAVIDGTIYDTHNALTPLNLELARGYWRVK